MDLIGGDGDGEDEAAVVVVFFNNAGKEAADADAIGAHDDGGGFAILTEVGGAEGVCVASAEFEDVADFDTTGGAEFATAFDAGATGFGDGDVCDDVGFEVAAVVDVDVVIVFLIGAGDEVVGFGYEVVGDDDEII